MSYKVTIFKHLKDTGASFIEDIDVVLDRIKNGNSKKEIEEYRATKNTEIKQNLVGVCFNGEFNHRSLAGCIKHSGLIVLDFDDVGEDKIQEFKKEISKDEYIYACWISPSGDGLKVLVKIPPSIEDHKSYFDALEKHFNYPYWDVSGKDVPRFCFESYDPEIYINKDSSLWEVKELPTIEEIGTTTPIIAVESEQRKVQNLLTWWEKKYGFVDGERSNNLFKLASSFNDFGINKSTCESVLMQFERKDFNSKEILSIIKSAYRKSSSFGTKFFEDKLMIEKIDKLVRAGKNEADIINALPEIKPETVRKTIDHTKENQSVNDFWTFDKKGKISLSPHKFKFWLQQNHFLKYYPTNTSTYTFIHKKGNFLDETSDKRIKDFTLNNLLGRSDVDYKPYDFMANNSKYFQSDFLSFLDSADIDLKEDTATASYIYYNNCVVEVTKNSIKEISYVDICGFVWKRQIIDRDFQKSDHHPSEFRKFIWLISGQNEDRYNSFKSVIGYLLHSYKTSANNKAIIFNDETISENPNGGSGKGLFWNALSKMKKVSSIDGKTFEFTKSFPYQTVSTDTQILVFDDVKKHFQFESLFSLITEGITLEYKGQDAIKLPVQKSPKILITTNYTVGGIGGSFERRKFEVEMSSYFSFQHTPLDEFGHLLFDDWSSDEWTRFDNYMLNCCQYFLENGLVSTDFNNLHIRKFIKETSHEFYEWSNDKDNIRFNVRLYKIQLFEEFKNEYPDYKVKLTQKRFSQWLEIFCKFNKYSFIMDRDATGRYLQINQGELMPDHNDKFI